MSACWRSSGIWQEITMNPVSPRSHTHARRSPSLSLLSSPRLCAFPFPHPDPREHPQPHAPGAPLTPIPLPSPNKKHNRFSRNTEGPLGQHTGLFVHLSLCSVCLESPASPGMALHVASCPLHYHSHQAAVRWLRFVSLSVALAKKIMTVLNGFITVNCRLRSVNTGGATHLAFNCIHASGKGRVWPHVGSPPVSGPPQPQPLWTVFWGRFVTQFGNGPGSCGVRAERGIPALPRTSGAAFCTRFSVLWCLFQRGRKIRRGVNAAPHCALLWVCHGEPGTPWGTLLWNQANRENPIGCYQKGAV